MTSMKRRLLPLTYGLAKSASCSSKMKFVVRLRVKRSAESASAGTIATQKVGSLPKKYACKRERKLIMSDSRGTPNSVLGGRSMSPDRSITLSSFAEPRHDQLPADLASP